jgi:hypothetical protein
MSDKSVKYVQAPTPAVNPSEIADAQNNPDIIDLYFNGFTMGISSADVVILLKQNNMPKVACNLSLTTAKTLAKQLNALIINFEVSAEREIMTSDIIDQALAKMRDDKR